MPLYDFECKECKKQFTEIITSKPLNVQCEHCGSSKVERKFPVPSAPTMGRTRSDFRVRDKLKRSDYRPKSAALFDNPRTGQVI